LIDLHCHILPGIDDGAADMDDAVAMAHQAAEDGIETVCATPHIRHDHDVRIEELERRVDELNRALDEHGLPVSVSRGGELAETAAAGLDSRELRAISLDGRGRWVLLEPAPGPIGDSLAHTARALRHRGARSVIAHPERHASDELAHRLTELVSEGALVQVTAAFVEGGPAAPAMLELAATGLVHLVGSDAHSARAGRPVRLSGGIDALGRVPALAGHLDWIAREAPAAILRGEDVAPPFPVAA